MTPVYPLDNYCDKFHVKVFCLWITFYVRYCFIVMFVIVPRGTIGGFMFFAFCVLIVLWWIVFFASLWFCCSLFVCWLLCQSAGVSAGLYLSAACALVYRAQPLNFSLCLPVPGIFCWWLHCYFTFDLCRLHLLAGCLFSCLVSISVVHSDIFVFADVHIITFVIVY